MGSFASPGPNTSPRFFTRLLDSFMNAHFSAFFHPSFRMYWFGLLISIIGSWMQQTAQSWLVLTLTNSPIKLGLVGAAQYLPILVFSLFAGVIIDHLPKQKIIIYTQIVSMVLALILAILVYLKMVEYWHVLVLALLLGVVNSIDMPSRQAYLIDLVAKEDIISAVSLNSVLFNISRILGPMIAGVIMAQGSLASCFLWNAVSFIAIIISMMKIGRIPKLAKIAKLSSSPADSPLPDPIAEGPSLPSNKRLTFQFILSDIKKGLAYIYQNQYLFQSITIIFFIGSLGFNFNIFIPLLAKNVLFLGEADFGILWSAMGVGSLIGGLSSSFLNKRYPPTFRLILFHSLCISLILICFGSCKSYSLALLLLVLFGISSIWFSTLTASFLHLATSDQFRGRIMSVYTLVFAGSTPFGNFFSGLMAETVGISAAFIINGLCIILLISFTLLFWYREMIARQPLLQMLLQKLF